MLSFEEALAKGRVSTGEALTLFDALEPVSIEELLGRWRGAGFPTGHPLDGQLERCHWHGKRFDSAEEVHPLVFSGRDGALVHVDPRLVLPAAGALERWPWLGSEPAAALFRSLLPLLATDRSRARLLFTSWRGKVSATMVYDHLPIHDFFRRVDADTVLGLMDRKGSEQPFFFFVLHREP